MSTSLRKFVVVGAMTAAAAAPFAFSGLAGAQDAGDCGDGGVAAASESTSTGGLVGALIPISLQVVAPINLPVASPSAVTCNTNINEVNTVTEVEKTIVVTEPEVVHVPSAPLPQQVAPQVIAVPRFAG